MSFDNITSIINSIPTAKSAIDALNAISQQLSIYLPLVLTIFGLIGFLGNLLTYLQPELRFNTCCIYLLCESIVDIINILLNLFPQYLGSKYGIFLPWSKSSSLCKLSVFLLTFIPHLSTNFLLMAIIDRFAATCSLTSPIRRILPWKMVPFMITFALIISALLSFYTIVYYDTVYGVYGVYGLQCESTQPVISNILYIILIGLIQPIFMLIFVLLTYRNVRRTRQRIGGVNERNANRHRAKFIVMIFGQIFITALLTLQWIILYTYSTFTVYDEKTYEQIVIFIFIFAISYNLFYFNNVKTFYISLFTAKLFRKTFLKTLMKFFPQRIRGRDRLPRANIHVAAVARNH